MFLSIERCSQLSFVSPNITADSRFRLSLAWVVGVTRARASRLDSRLRVNAQLKPEPAREAPVDDCYENTEVAEDKYLCEAVYFSFLYITFHIIVVS